MKRIHWQLTARAAGALLVSGLLSIPALAQAGQGNGPSGPEGDGLATYLATLPAAELSASEAAGLLFTYKEEKLARDVYTAMAATWKVRIFANIAKAEQSHMDAAALMIDRYDLADAAAGLPAGTFVNAGLQQFYADLVAKGSLSLVHALVAGATIEELDLRDVTALIAGADNVDLDALYQNLAKGSRNHLRSFVDQLALVSATYLPLYLDQATFDAIVAADMEKGVYDAAGVPVVIPGGGTCDGSGHGPGDGDGVCDGSGAGNGASNGAGDGTCDGSGQPSRNGGNGNQGGGRP